MISIRCNTALRPLLSTKHTFPRSSCRALSTQASNAILKLRSAVEEYRMKNYTQELPSRCKKDIVKAADCQNSGNITLDGLQSIVKNIDAQSKVSMNEIESIFSELGKDKRISSSTLLNIL